VHPYEPIGERRGQNGTGKSNGKTAGSVAP
jgi:hypothetical protein